MDVVNGRDRPVLPSFLGLGLGAALVVAVASPARAVRSFVNTLLRQQRFSAADLRALDAGEAVVKSLDTPVRRELAQFGVVHSTPQPIALSIRFLTSSGSIVVPVCPRSVASALFRDQRIWRR